MNNPSMGTGSTGLDEKKKLNTTYCLFSPPADNAIVVRDMRWCVTVATFTLSSKLGGFGVSQVVQQKTSRNSSSPFGHVFGRIHMVIGSWQQVLLWDSSETLPSSGSLWRLEHDC